MPTEKITIENANNLAMKFYQYYGYELTDKSKSFFRFDMSSNFRERGMWDLAKIAYEFIAGTDIEDAIK